MAQIIMSFRKRRPDRECFFIRLYCGLGLLETRQSKAKILVRFGRFIIDFYCLPKQPLSVLEIILLQPQNAKTVKQFKSSRITVKQADIKMFGLDQLTRCLQGSSLLKQIRDSSRIQPDRRCAHQESLRKTSGACANLC